MDFLNSWQPLTHCSATERKTDPVAYILNKCGKRSGNRDAQGTGCTGVGLLQRDGRVMVWK